MVIVSRKITYQINDNEFETITDSATFDDNAIIKNIKDWRDKQNASFHYYASPAIQLLFVEN